MKALAKRLIALVNRPILLALLPLLPFDIHSYIAGVGHGTDRERPVFYLLARLIVAGNLPLARRLLAQRLLRIPVERRRELAKRVWSAGSTEAWAERAFDNVENRSRNYAYQAIKAIQESEGRPISVLEFGCMNGGSLHCLQHLEVSLKRFAGVDISEALVGGANKRFPESEFYAMDFLDYCQSTEDHFDVLLCKQTLIFLDQEYLQVVLALVGSKRIANRIVFHEYNLKGQGSESRVMEIGNASVNYSHDYMGLCSEAGYELERGGIIEIDREDKEDLEFFDCVMKQV